MSVAELKKSIIESLNFIDDAFLLKQINEVLTSSASNESKVYFTNEQINLIEEAEADIKNGDVLTDEEANNEIDEWLKK